jgi:hypothetical protein
MVQRKAGVAQDRQGWGEWPRSSEVAGIGKLVPRHTYRFGARECNSDLVPQKTRRRKEVTEDHGAFNLMSERYSDRR